MGAAPLVARGADVDAAGSTPETVAKLLYESLNDEQRKEICFAWDYTEDRKRGLLRTRISNNWNITKPTIGSDFYNSDQQAMIKHIFESMIQPDWHKRIYKQLEDDAQGYGEQQSIAMFGKPGEKFEFVMTGRHMTIRCDGNSADHVAFGGPIFYGHAAERLQRKAEPSGQRLLAPGPGRQQGLRNARRKAAQAGAGRKAAQARKPWRSKGPAASFPAFRWPTCRATRRAWCRKCCKS